MDPSQRKLGVPTPKPLNPPKPSPVRTLVERILGFFRKPAPKGKPEPSGRPVPPSAEARKPARWTVSRFVVPPVEGKTRFHDLGLPDELMHAVSDLGFQYCTPVQAAVLPQALTGRDVAGQAQTGTGKTAAFLITIFAQFLRTPPPQRRRPASPRALIIAPTRELVLQIEKDARSLVPYLPLSVVPVFGGMEFEKQRKVLSGKPVDVIVATPGRLLDFQRRKYLNLGMVEIMVIDEADRMLDMGFIPDVRRIIESTPPKNRRQTMLFSATLTPDVRRLASQWTRDAMIVEIQPEQVTVDTVDQRVYITTTGEKFTLLYNMIVQQDLERVLVFCNRRDVSQRLSDRLTSHGISCGLLSGDIDQEKRIRTLEGFRTGKFRVLVATDVAARGLHVEGISAVVNYNLPMNAEDYVHRIGRTGRAGATGTSVSFACEEDAPQLPVIEEFIGRKLTAVYPDDAWLRALPAPKADAGKVSHPHGVSHRRRPSGGRSSGGNRRHRRS
jgi:ATP-dependent RNA helicase RhlB